MREVVMAMCVRRGCAFVITFCGSFPGLEPFFVVSPSKSVLFRSCFSHNTQRYLAPTCMLLCARCFYRWEVLGVSIGGFLDVKGFVTCFLFVPCWMGLHFFEHLLLLLVIPHTVWVKCS